MVVILKHAKSVSFLNLLAWFRECTIVCLAIHHGGKLVALSKHQLEDTYLSQDGVDRGVLANIIWNGSSSLKMPISTRISVIQTGDCGRTTLRKQIDILG